MRGRAQREPVGHLPGAGVGQRRQGGHLRDAAGPGVLLGAVGAAGFFIRKNAIVLLLCIEIMLNAVNLIFASFARFLYGTVKHDP